MMLWCRRGLRLVLFVAVAGAVSASRPSSGSANPLSHLLSSVPFGAHLQGPVLVATGGKTGLEYWPLGPKGSRTPTEIGGISGLHPSGGIAANGQQIAIPNGTNVLVYDLQSKRETILPDPDGTPLDAAIGRDGTLYVDNLAKHSGNVLIYPRAGKPYEVTCGLLKAPEYIAVDNEGDVFLNDVVLTGVVEIPNGPAGLDAAHCRLLKLTPRESGYAAGITIDPRTDDLLVLDNPSLCAGGLEGRLIIHQKPYERGAGRSLHLGINCSSGVRLDAASSAVLIGDETFAGPPSFILTHSYPDGKPLGTFSGGSPGGFITIPNALPN